MTPGTRVLVKSISTLISHKYGVITKVEGPTYTVLLSDDKNTLEHTFTFDQLEWANNVYSLEAQRLARKVVSIMKKGS